MNIGHGMVKWRGAVSERRAARAFRSWTPAAAEILEDRVLLAQLVVTGADQGGGPHVRAFDAETGALVLSFFAYDPAFTGGVRVATADVTGDGQPDIITAPGPGGGPQIRVFNGQNGQFVQEFLAYGTAFTGGVFLATGDVNGDLRADIITGAGAGGGPHVKVFSGMDYSELTDFFAYDPGFTGGVHVAAAEMTGDDRADIVTGPGAGGGPHVKVFSGANRSMVGSFFAYGAAFTGGVFVAAGDVNIDGRADIATGPGAGGGPHVKVFNGNELDRPTPGVLGQAFVYDAGFTGGVRVGMTLATGDNKADLVTAPGRGGGPHVKVFDCATFILHAQYFAYDAAFGLGVNIAGSLPVTTTAQSLSVAQIEPTELSAGEQNSEEQPLAAQAVTGGTASGGQELDAAFAELDLAEALISSADLPMAALGSALDPTS